MTEEPLDPEIEHSQMLEQHRAEQKAALEAHKSLLEESPEDWVTERMDALIAAIERCPYRDPQNPTNMSMPQALLERLWKFEVETEAQIEAEKARIDKMLESIDTENDE